MSAVEAIKKEENMKNISIYYRFSGKNHKLDISEGNNIASEFCRQMAERTDTDKSEIQMVTADGISLYNSLRSEPISWNDLENYFAQSEPEHTLIR